jgi:hypothetical protein
VIGDGPDLPAVGQIADRHALQHGLEDPVVHDLAHDALGEERQLLPPRPGHEHAEQLDVHALVGPDEVPHHRVDGLGGLGRLVQDQAAHRAGRLRRHVTVQEQVDEADQHRRRLQRLGDTFP